jgi:APA family basic amino acid/polyamine antiporter
MPPMTAETAGAGAHPGPSLGFWAATALVVGNMIGSGLFLLPSALAGYGGVAALGFALSAVGAVLLALVFARLGLCHPRSGGPYAYARLAFGDATGFAVAWSYWVSNWCGNAAIAVALAGYFGALVPGSTATPMRAAALAVAALWLCTVFNLRGVRSAGVMQLVLTAAKLLPLAAIIALGAWSVDAANWHPFNRSAGGLLSATTATAALTLWAFLGLECATIPAAEVRDPQRTIPRATVVGTAIAIVVTVGACMIVVGVLPASALALSAAPFVDAAARLWGGPAGMLFGAAAALSCIGALNGWVLMQGQLPLAVARDGLFPAAFARCDARGTPWLGLVISSVLSSVLVVANYQRSLIGMFTFAILLSTAATLLAYLVCSAAALRLREGTGRNIAGMLVALGALAFSVWALVGTGVESLLWGLVLILLGAPLYLWQRRRRTPVSPVRVPL